MITLNKARVLHYKPRNTHYYVVHHDVQIKQIPSFLDTLVSKLKFIKQQPSWITGCVYRCSRSGKLYTRPYEMFDESNWEILK